MSIYRFNEEDAYRFAREQNIRAKKIGGQLRFQQCPYCKNNNPSFDKDTFAISLDTGQFNCLRASCGVKGNMITLAKDFGFSLGRDVDEYLHSKKRFRNLRQYARPVVTDKAVEYMESRGLSESTVQMFDVTTKEGQDNVLCFPFYDEHEDLQFVKYRKMDFDKEKDKSKEWCLSGCKPILFGMDHCSPFDSESLVITEGQIDSMSVFEAFGGGINAVSVPTGAKGFTWVPYCWDFLTRFKELIVFGDYENGKVSLLDELKTRFPGIVKCVQPEDYRGCKDANELLVTHGAKAVAGAVMRAVTVKTDRITALADVERKDLSKMQSMATELPSLDKLTGGLLFGTLVIISGERGNGKSTLASQFITKAIGQGYTSFIYSGELMNWIVQDWLDRQIAGPRNINALETKTGYINYLIHQDAISKAHEWYSEKCYIYDTDAAIQDDSDEDLITVLEKAIQRYGCRVLLVDNLMTAMVDNLQADLYRQQGNFVKRLSQMAKKYDVLILLVAHPRKRMTENFTNDDILGSSNITNLADVIMRYDKPKEDKNDPNPPARILQVSKNRLNGKTHPGIPLYFDDASKRISEEAGWFDWKFDWKAEDDFVDADDMDEIPF